MNIKEIGINEIHDSNFQINKVNGFDEYLLLLLKTPALFQIEDEWITVPEVTAILYAPHSTQRYKALNENYIDDWMLLDCTQAEMDRYGITTNVPFHILDAERTYSIFRIMKDEYTLHSYTFTPTVEHLLSALLYKLSEASAKKDDITLSLNVIRRELWRYPMKDWNLEKVSRMAKLSISRFETLYAKTFGISFGADVIESRIQYACELLKDSKLSIKEISDCCGYSSSSYFVRQFRKKTGLTPGEYRTQNPNPKN